MSQTLVKRSLRISGQVLLTFGALLGTACLVMAIVGAAYDVKPLIFRSGSMAPAIPAGGLALAKPVDAPAMKAGDIVSVRSEGTRITHRIKAVELDGDTAVLTLKGDANEVQDAHPYRVKSADRVFFAVPVAGYVLSYASGPIGVFVTGLLAALLVWLMFRPAGGGGGARRAPKQRRTGATGVLLIAAVALSVPVARASPAWAAFSDTGTANGSSLAAHTVVRPTSASCSAALLSATVTWTDQDARYDYEVVLRRVSNNAVVSTRQITGSSVSTTYTGLSDFGLVVGAGTVDFNVEIRSKLSSATSWQSSTVRTYSSIRVLAIVIGATVSCTT